MLAQPGDVFCSLLVVLFAADQQLDVGIEGLDANFKLQRTGRESSDCILQRGRQMIGNDFKMGKYRILRRRRQFIEKKLHDPQTRLDIQVERAIDKFEQAGAARMQHFQLRHE